MTKITNDSSIVYNLLDNYFTSSFKLNESQVFILATNTLKVIIYEKLPDSEVLTCFEHENEANLSISANHLITHFNSELRNDNPLFQKAIDQLHEFLLNLKSNPLFFDAH
jgi:hypothetical protein